MGGIFKSLVGRLGLGATNNLVARQGAGYVNVSQPCVDATITVSAEGASTANVRDITIQLQDAEGNDIDYVETVEIIMFTSAAMTAFATGGSTGIEIDGDGALLPVVAKKLFLATSESDGDIAVKWTDTGTESVALGVRLPNGRVVVSDAFANT